MLRKMRQVIRLFGYSAIRQKDILLCFLSALLLILSFPNFNFWPLAWFAFIPIFFALKNKSLKEAFLLFFITGIIFWTGTIFWLVHVTLAGTILLILYLSLYFAVFGLIIRPFTISSTPIILIFVPSVWVLLEYVRGFLFTGFPWALLGYSQYQNLPVIQVASLTGAWGVSFLVMFINTAIMEIIWSLKSGKRLRLTVTFFVASLLLSSTLCYGYFRLAHWNEQSSKTLARISVIQGNIPQAMKWDRQYARLILKKYAELTVSAAGNSPDLIVWPEAAIPGMLGEDNWVYQDVFSLVKEIKIPLLTGAVIEEGGHYFGSAILIGTSGEIKGRYDKLHLVPFGEYIPLKRYLPFLATVVPIGDIEKGKEFTIFQVTSHKSQVTSKFAVLDCFEDVFPSLARQFTRRGADFLVNITNDAWYKETSAPFQHLQASVFRAVENMRPLARAANTGISGFISPYGQIISLVSGKNKENIFVSGYDTLSISAAGAGQTFYTLHGDIIIFVCLFFAAYGIITAPKKHR